HTRSTRDWSSDVCSSDLAVDEKGAHVHDRIIDRGVLVKDPNREALASNQNLRGDDLGLQHRRRIAGRSGASTRASAASGKEERKAPEKRDRPTLTPAEDHSAGGHQDTASST